MLVLLAGLAAVQAVHLEFSKGLEGFIHSDDAKYAGNKFVVEVPEGLTVKALKVGHPTSILAQLFLPRPPE